MNWNFHFNQNYFRVYHKLLSGARDKKEAEFLTKFIPSKDSPVLDFGCGWGRHLKELAQMGYTDLTGVDYAEALLQKAKGFLKDYPKAKLVNSTFVDFKLDRKFDFIFQVFQAFGYETREYDQENLNNVSSLLSKSGVYLLDLRSPNLLMNNEKFDLPGDVQINVSFDNESKREKFTYHFDGEEDVGEYNVYTLDELKEMFDKVGLEIVKTFGGFDSQSYSPTSERLIIIANKSK